MYLVHGCEIKNCSVNNIQIKIETIEESNSRYVGGIVGNLSAGNVENSYVYGLELLDSSAIISSIGGIAGYTSGSNKIRNCYAEGIIESDNMNVGGLVGTISTATSVSNCYSKVNISTTNINVGGIAGTYYGSDFKNITNNLSIGNIYSTTGKENISRIIGNNLESTNNNFAYNNQLLNGYIDSRTDGAALLSKEEILDFNMGSSYNYEGAKDNILPKLYTTDGKELLPNQEDIYIDDNVNEEAKLEIESIEAIKLNTTEAEITIVINNLGEVEITGITIEDMASTIERNVTQNGLTSITIRSKPERYYDSYKLTEVKYKIKETGEEKVKKVEAEVEVQFYKEIYTYEDWQSIEENTYQNYRLMADIDFSGRTNIKNNITVNRLEAENNIYTLKNIKLEINGAKTGLIKNVKASMKNIGFQNITLNNTKSSGEYFGIISTNNGDLQNLKFDEITITANNLNHIGIIGCLTAGNVSNVELSNVTVSGNNYVGGLIGNVNTNNIEIKNVDGKNIQITGRGNYVAGIVGYAQNFTNSSMYEVSVTDSNISGYDYAAGVISYINSGTRFSDITVNNTEVKGNSYVGGVISNTGTVSSNIENIRVNSSYINGVMNYIGGIFGIAGRNTVANVILEESEVTASNLGANYTGGICGSMSLKINNFQVHSSNINSNGSYVGGVIGSNTQGVTIEGGYVNNSNVSGNSNVGGIAGGSEWIIVAGTEVNANVTANEYNVGGIIGYLDNEKMTNSANRSAIHTNLIADSKVKANSKVGGVIGDISVEIYRPISFFYDNYIDADVTSENESTGSLIIGGRPDENEYITNTYVYKYSILNGDYVYASNDNIEDNKFLVRDDLNVQSTFQNKIRLGTTYWDYASLQEEKYPIIKDTYLYMPELQEGIDLPTDPEIVDLNSINEINDSSESDENGIATQSIEALPEITVYPVSVNEINIDFSSIPENTSFTYYINGAEIETIDLTEKTYTFEYNFVDALEVKLSNGTEEESITINPSDIRREISLVGSNYAYLIGNNLYINGELQSGKYVNIYSGYALNNDGQVIDLSRGEIVENEMFGTRLEETAKPLHSYEYKENSIEVYGTYSKIDENIKLQIYNVRSGKLSALSNSLDMKIDNYVVDQYNDKEYQTILTNSGEIIDLKEKLNYPSNFLSRNIKQIVQNSAVENPEMMVLYNTGKVIVFNYVNGNVIYENSEQADSGLANYITGSISSIWSDYENKQSEYLKSKALIAKLAQMPVEEAINEKNAEEVKNNSVIENSYNMLSNENNSFNNSTNVDITNTTTNTSDSYITVYNGETGEYEVYSESEILEGSEENPVSETEKIKENGLEGIYNYETEESKPQLNGAVIVILIISLIIIALIILRIIVSKRKK